MAGALKVWVPGKSTVTLNDTHYLATGGEGTVYAKDGLVYKLYLDPEAARNRGIAEKIDLLQQLKHPFVVAPLGVLENQKQETIGFYMEEAQGVPLVKTFTNVWRDPNGFGLKESLQLIENMRRAMAFVHDAGAVLVDANEMNYLAHGVEPRLLDVDSWQVGRFRASAVMPSIRDPHAKVFDKNSDWFAWAVVSFQVLTGIHPFKGTHPGFKRGDMVGRMAANVSVLDPAVHVSAGVRDFADIPGHLLDWYREVFQNGYRSEAPDVFAPKSASTSRRKKQAVVQSASSALHFEHITDLPSTPRVALAGGFAVVAVGAELQLFDLQRKCLLTGATNLDVEGLMKGTAAVVRQAGSVVFATLSGQGVQAVMLRGPREPVPANQLAPRLLPFNAAALASWDGRLFALAPNSELGLSEIQIDIFGEVPLLSVKGSWPFLAKSAKSFSSMAIFDALGLPYLVIPAGEAVHVAKCPALRAHEVLDAFALSESRVVVLALKKSDGQLYQMTLARNPAGSFEVEAEVVCDLPQLTWARSEKGLALFHRDGNELVVMSGANGAMKVLKDHGLAQDAPLLSFGGSFFTFAGSALLRVSMSK